ncbi:MAG: DnaA regulatory inactivator Hda, partial [Cellvibrionaceae bacterium]|nr:DnaA regulatory inactivator Hda [Cellvibrionaceae bacterium]
RQPRQLSLGINLADDATFANFYTASGSVAQQACQAVEALFSETHEHCIYLWGGSGSGISHLLQAACHRAQQPQQSQQSQQSQERQISSQYLPLAELVGFAPEALLEGLEQMDLVCIDDLQAVAGMPEWEQALFNLFNRSKDCGRRLLIGASASPTELPLELADLRSRLGWGLVFGLPQLSDDDKRLALQRRAKARGLDLSDEVAQYILHRAPRHTGELFACLDQLDNASLAEQRRLTIPFVKQVLGF